MANPVFGAIDCSYHKPGDGSWLEHDARGIPLCRVCEKCKATKLAKYRPDVLTDKEYWHDEPLGHEEDY